MATSPLLDIEETLEWGPLTYDIWYRLASTLKWATKEGKVIEAKLHLKPILKLREVRNMENIEFYGDKGGYCSKNDVSSSKCDIENGVLCHVMRDMMHD